MSPFFSIQLDVLGEAVKAIRAYAKRNQCVVNVTRDDLSMALHAHMAFVSKWSSEVKFRDMLKARSLEDVYVDLSMRISQRRFSNQNELRNSLSLEEMFSVSSKHLILLGDAGAGKTTSTKRMCKSLLRGSGMSYISNEFPIVIELRSLRSDETIHSKLLELLGIVISFDRGREIDNLGTGTKGFVKKILLDYVETLRPLIILDGLDEVQPTELLRFIEEIQELMANLSEARVLFTCRSAAFNYSFNHADVFEICPLNEEQINTFVTKWLGDKDRVEGFFKELRRTSFVDTTIRPLNLAHICVLYDRTGSIPDKPKTLFRKLLNVLIEAWDEQRGIQRPSKYVNFEADRKYEFLCSLAYELTTRYRDKEYTSADIKKAFLSICRGFGLASNEVKYVMEELEAHNGIFICTGNDAYEFSHRSFQEYMTAEYIVKLHELPARLFLDVNIANELAIAVTLSSVPNRYFYNIVLNHFNAAQVTVNTVIEFLKRLLQERPDFVSSPLLAISFLHLINRYYRGGFHDMQDSKFVPVSLVGVEFEHVLKMALKEGAIRASFQIYLSFISTQDVTLHGRRCTLLVDGPRIKDVLNLNRENMFAKRLSEMCILESQYKAIQKELR